MDTVIRFPGTTYGCSDSGMFICGYTLASLFEGKWEDKDFTICITPRTNNRRPRIDALKIHVPENFITEGLGHELPDGSMDYTVLASSADRWIEYHDLEESTLWVWIEL